MANNGKATNHHKIQFLHPCSGAVTHLAIILYVQENGPQNSWMKRLVEPSPYERRPANLTTALHKGHVRSLSNLLFPPHTPEMWQWEATYNIVSNQEDWLVAYHHALHNPGRSGGWGWSKSQSSRAESSTILSMSLAITKECSGWLPTHFQMYFLAQE
jgi:hypothetical protein